jgi:hypothetical protein
LETLKHIVIRYTGFVWAMMKPLGSWAVFVIAGIDSISFGQAEAHIGTHLPASRIELAEF